MTLSVSPRRLSSIHRTTSLVFSLCRCTRGSNVRQIRRPSHTSILPRTEPSIVRWACSVLSQASSLAGGMDNVPDRRSWCPPKYFVPPRVRGPGHREGQRLHPPPDTLRVYESHQRNIRYCCIPSGIDRSLEIDHIAFLQGIQFFMAKDLTSRQLLVQLNNLATSIVATADGNSLRFEENQVGIDCCQPRCIRQCWTSNKC